MKQVNYDNSMFYDKEIMVHHVDSCSEIELAVQIRDFHGKPDCQVGHFGYNFYFRTNAGMKFKKYTSRKKLETAIEQVLKKNNFKILGWNNK